MTTVNGCSGVTGNDHPCACDASSFVGVLADGSLPSGSSCRSSFSSASLPSLASRCARLGADAASDDGSSTGTPTVTTCATCTSSDSARTGRGLPCSVPNMELVRCGDVLPMTPDTGDAGPDRRGSGCRPGSIAGVAVATPSASRALPSATAARRPST